MRRSPAAPPRPRGRPPRGLVRVAIRVARYPNPDAGFVHGDAESLRLFHFVGRVLGKALREGVTVQPRFARSFLGVVRGDVNYASLLEDLGALDPELQRNLRFLARYDGDVADLGLDFTVSFDRFGATVTENLRPGGDAIDVTSLNRHAYARPRRKPPRRRSASRRRRVAREAVAADDPRRGRGGDATHHPPQVRPGRG